MTNIALEQRDAIATITIDRPEKRNAMTPPMWGELLEVLQSLTSRTDVRAVVLTGAGADAFCAGADLWTPAGEGPPPHALHQMRRIGDVVLALHNLPQPTIARVRGVAAGAGLNLALACDLVVASENARFSEIFVKRGLSVDAGGSWVLPRLVGLHKAKELVLLGDIIDAPTALAYGLVNRVVADAELDAFVADWAGRLAGGPPLAMLQSKRLLNASFEMTLAQALDAEAATVAVNSHTADTAEAISAFMQKREPVFKGR